MPRRIKYEPALRNYNKVKFFPFPVEPGEPYMLTSNPWNFLETWLNNEINIYQRRTARKDHLEKSLYFLSLAESFQKAAESATLPAKGTLTYYSILNLIKVYLLTQGINLEKSIEFHGLSLESDKDKELKAAGNSTSGINIFSTFCEFIDSPITAGDRISLDEMISEIPEIHEMTFNLGKLHTTKRKFLPVDINVLTNQKRRSHLIIEIRYDKKYNNLMQVDKLKSGKLREKLELYSDTGDNNLITYRTKERINYTYNSHHSWRNNYQKIQEELIDMGIAVILTRKGYRYYLNLQPNKHKPIVYFVALMYYIGAVARYRPTLYNETLAGEYQAVLNETLETCPRQFLYYMASMITKKVCAVPMAKI